MSLIRLESVSFSYSQDEDRKALDGLNVEIENGAFVSVIGSNGSGKSTFSRLLNGLLCPASGCVLVDGLDTKVRKNLSEIRRKVGLVFQNPDNQIVSETVEEDIAFAPENLGLSRDEISRRVEEALICVGLLDKRYRNPGELSGGEKARLSLAGILAMDPEVLVLDEVTAMLDEKGRDEILEILLKLKNKGKTIILITHHAEETLLSDRVLVFDNGRIVQDGNPREVFSNPVSSSMPLPFVSRLVQILDRNGVHILDGMVTLEDLESLGGKTC